MDAISIYTLCAYVVAILLIAFLWRSRYTTEIFRIRKGVFWVVGAVSLFMYLNSPNDIQIYSEVIQRDGIPGIGFLACGWLASAFAPILFAPAWKQLNLKTDNEIILLRFSGTGSKVLFYFRAIYLALIISPLLVSFQVLAFSNLLKHLWDIPMQNAIYISGVCLLISGCKNSLGITFRIDMLHGILYMTAIVIILILLFREVGSLHSAIGYLEDKKRGMTSFFPTASDHKAWWAFVVIFGIQWWSTGLFDGGGPEMQKYNSVASPQRAVLLALGGLLLTLVFSQMNFLISLLSVSVDRNGEIGFFPAIKSIIPSSMKMLVTLGLWSGIVSTAESIMNWGASYVVENLIYRNRVVRSEKKKALYSILILISMTFFAVLLTLGHSTLRSILEVFLAFSAGVAPVFFLRWFWMRINAWTQLSAMVASVVYSVLFDKYQLWFLKNLPTDLLELYYWKLIILTLLTSFTWGTVMYLTPPDDKQHIEKFLQRIPERKVMLRRASISMLVGAGILLLYYGCIYQMIRI